MTPTATHPSFAGRIRLRLEEKPPGSPYTLGRILAVYAGVMAVIMLSGLDQTIVATALPQIVSNLHGLSSYSWIFTSYLLFQTVSIPIYGKLGDVYGRRPLLLSAIGIFLVGSVLCGLAQSMLELAIFRAIQGVGAGGLIPLAVAGISELVSPRDRGRYQGLISATIVTAAVLGPTVGGLIVDHASWRWIFFVNIPFGGLALLVIAVTMPRQSARREHVIDYLGSVLLAAGTSLVLLALVWGGNTYPWLSWEIVAAAAAGCALLVAFAAAEGRAPEPILPFEVIRIPAVAAGSICWALSAMCMFGTLAFVPLYAQGVIGASGTSTGLVLIPLMLGIVIAATASGTWVSRTGRYRGNALLGPIVLGVGMALLWRMDTSTTTTDVARNMVICGLGIGSMNQIFMLSAQNAIPNSLIGVATAVVQFGRAIGTTLGVTVFGVIVNQGLPPALRGQAVAHRLPKLERAQLAHALHPAFLFGVGLCVLILLIAYRMIGHEPLRTTVDEPTTLLEPTPVEPPR